MDSPSLDQILSEETRELRAFLLLLDREQQALLDGPVDQLLPIAQEKNQTASRLNALALRRIEWLAAQGFGTGREAVAAWLGRLAQNAPPRVAWQTLLELAIRARRLNEENGALIRTRMQHNQQALAVLLAASDQATLYGPDGHTLAGPGKRHLGSV